MITSPHLDGRGRYERSMDGWVDDADGNAFTHTVRIGDDRRQVELSAVCTPSPGYEVRSAKARALDGDVDPTALDRLGDLAGARMVGGFTRRLTELAGGGPGAQFLVDAGIEIARLARQATRLAPEVAARALTGGARACWELDNSGWVDLPNSCFTYSSKGRALLDSREVTTPMVVELYSPPRGARRVFVRRKVMRLVHTAPRLHLFHAMHDNVHGFDLHYEIDLLSDTIVAADSVTSRLPYQGICTEPQVRIHGLVGERVDAGLRKRIRVLVGGEQGCAQLYDLTADLLKLLSL
jgi:Protein of unknown function (DUF2889)